MQIRKLSSLIGLSAVLLIGPLTAAQAQRPGLYFGGAWGAYSIKKSNLDDNDDVIKGYVGGQILPWLAIEGSISDFNRLNNVNGERFEADGRGLAALFSVPLGTTSTFFGKVGQFWWDADTNFNTGVSSKDGNDPFYGVGFKFGFNDHLAFRLEAERYDVSRTRLKTFMAGLEFKF